MENRFTPAATELCSDFITTEAKKKINMVSVVESVGPSEAIEKMYQVWCEANSSRIKQEFCLESNGISIDMTQKEFILESMEVAKAIGIPEEDAKKAVVLQLKKAFPDSFLNGLNGGLERVLTSKQPNIEATKEEPEIKDGSDSNQYTFLQEILDYKEVKTYYGDVVVLKNKSEEWKHHSYYEDLMFLKSPYSYTGAYKKHEKRRQLTTLIELKEPFECLNVEDLYNDPDTSDFMMEKYNIEREDLFKKYKVSAIFRFICNRNLLDLIPHRQGAYAINGFLCSLGWILPIKVPTKVTGYTSEHRTRYVLSNGAVHFKKKQLVNDTASTSLLWNLMLILCAWEKYPMLRNAYILKGWRKENSTIKHTDYDNFKQRGISILNCPMWAIT